MRGYELYILGFAALGWAALAFLTDVLGPPPRTRAESSPFRNTDFGVE